MQPKQILRAIVAPITELTVLAVVVLFSLLLTLGAKGGLLGVLIILFSLPPIFRYQILIVEACARGRQPGALDAEYFNWIGGLYTFFPLPVSVAYGFAGFYAYEYFGIPGLVFLVILVCLHYPAMLAILAITHSPLQSINPIAIFHLYRRSGDIFWIAPVYLVAIALATIKTASLPLLAANFLQLFTMFSLAAVIGTLIAPAKLVDDVYIPDAIAPLRSKQVNDVQQARNLALNHGYGLVSRNNRAGGFKHIMDEIERDPEPTQAWRWYFERMLKWDDSIHALFFAQHYIRDMLRHGETIPAIKLTMRCHMLDEQFRPFPEDIPTLIEVAEDTGNVDLASVLKRM
ncbi:MAG: hypothetical protein AAFN50_02220 [Pseudomonadota bacterium]